MKTKLLTSFCVALLIGCATPQDKLQQYAADARDIGEVGTRLALLENPNYRTEIDFTIQGLKELEALPDPVTLDALTMVLQRLPVDELKTEKAQLYILSGRILLRRVGGVVELGSMSNIRPIVTALREGMEAGRSPL